MGRGTLGNAHCLPPASQLPTAVPGQASVGVGGKLEPGRVVCRHAMQQPGQWSRPLPLGLSLHPISCLH